MNSRERLIATLKHREPDRVPLDIGSTWNTGIHVSAYKNLLSHLKIKGVNIEIRDFVQQLALVGEDILERLDVDVRGIYPKNPSNWKLIINENDCKHFTDQYGIGWKMPKGGYYFDPFYFPLSMSSLDEIFSYPLPNPFDYERIEGLKEEAIRYRNNGFFIFMNSITGGFLEVCFWLRGYENFFCDLAVDPKFAISLMDILLEIEMNYWDFVLSELGSFIDVVYTANDLGAQNTSIISPSLYRKYIKPRQKKLNSFIKSKSPSVSIYYHSCG